jgi:hypothetical protein
MAPSTSGFGARSEPIASRAITVGIDLSVRASYRTERVGTYAGTKSRARKTVPRNSAALSLLFHFDHFTALIMTALRAGAMRHLALVTVGALGE